MTNGEMMTLKLKRLDMCDIRMALTSLICEMRRELHDEKTSEYRKEVLTQSIAGWEKLQAEVVRQFNEQDKDD